MPLPLNQRTNRLSIGSVPAVAAYAVPVALNMETSGGRPTRTGACAADSPLRKILRESLTRRVMTFAMGTPFGENEREKKLFKMKSGILKVGERAVDARLVGRCFVPAREVPENLLDHALLALFRSGQDLP